MTDLRKAAEMALETLCVGANDAVPNDIDKRFEQAIQALRQALAQPEQEPVVYLDEGLGAFYWPNQYKKGVGFTPLYAVPPHRWSNVTDDCLMEEVRRRGFVIRDAQIGREWVGLTEDELEDLEFASVDREYGHLDVRVLSQAIEAKLKEKNV